MVLVALILSVRLFFVQIVHGEEYERLADRQYQAKPEDLIDRGNIYFSDKSGLKVTAATQKSGYILAINPSQITNPEEVYNKLSIITDIDKKDFLSKSAKTEDPYEEIAKRLPENIAEKIKSLNILGVGVYGERWRYYPASTLAAHVVGFVGWRGDKLEGRYGLERYYEKNLKRGIYDAYQNFFAQIFENVKETIFDYDESLEGEIVTHIEPNVAGMLESELAKTLETWQGTSAGGVIIDPTSGAIYAMSAIPTYDPNSYSQEENVSVFSNPLVESLYEVGSIMKPITIAAGIDSGAVTPNSEYTDLGSITLDGKTVKNYDGRGRGRVSLQEVLNQSLNTGAVYVMQKMGKENFADYMRSFGFDDLTGVDLPSEARGLTDNLHSTREIEYATASFGQGVAVTPISMTRALSALANGGYLMKPQVVKSIRYNFGLETEMEPIEQGQVISSDTSEAVTRMLVKTVDEALKGGTVKIPTHSIAAKTGTAQMADPVNGGYYDDKYLHTFFGYFPAYKPRFLIFLYLENPRGLGYASGTLTDPFISLVKFLISYYEIPPDR